MSQVKTGLPPTGLGGSKDLKDVIPAIGAGVGIEDIGKAVEFFKKNRGVIGAILALFGIGKPKTPAPAPTTPAPAPTAPTSGSTTVPTPQEPAERRVASLRAKWFLIERKNTPGQQGGGRHIIAKGEFDAITSGADPARLGDRLHVDVTPIDQFGQAFQPGGEENKALLVDPQDREGELGKSRIEHVIEGNGELTSEYDDFGCTPVILVPWEGGRVDSDEESSVTYRAIYRGPNGERVESNTLPTIRIKA